MLIFQKLSCFFFAERHKNGEQLQMANTHHYCYNVNTEQATRMTYNCSVSFSVTLVPSLLWHRN